MPERIGIGQPDIDKSLTVLGVEFSVKPSVGTVPPPLGVTFMVISDPRATKLISCLWAGSLAGVAGRLYVSSYAVYSVLSLGFPLSSKQSL